ncbi:hypothetical protein D8S78_18870 [Natrialba swarupiae]|nr:hypothetical protein [Natrialba swarupiae]
MRRRRPRRRSTRRRSVTSSVTCARISPVRSPARSKPSPTDSAVSARRDDSPAVESTTGPGAPRRGGAAERTSRDDLLREFERWAERHGCSLEPGFRRESRPTSRFVVDSKPAADERIRVPVVALALYDGPPSEAADVRGVIPRTEPRDAGDERTITVDEWLAAVETGGREPTVETTIGSPMSSLEGTVSPAVDVPNHRVRPRQ